MKGSVSITYEGLNQIMQGFEKISGRGVSSLIKASARLCAVQLALRTQPFSVGQKGKGTAYDQGTKRVEYDIYKVIRSNEKLIEIADYITNPKIQERFRRLVESGDYESIAKILKATRISIGFGSDVEVLQTSESIKHAHKKNRSNKSGRSYGKSDKMYISRQNVIEKYIAMAQKRVGYSKAAWADCARKINAVKGDGARGIPAWAKSASHGSHGVVNDSSDVKPSGFVEMANTLPWTDRICIPVEREKANTFAKENFIKSLQRSFTAAAKKHPDMLGFIQSEIDATNTGE